MTNPDSGFRDATSLTRWTRGSVLEVPLALVLIAIVGRVHGRQMARQP